MEDKKKPLVIDASTVRGVSVTTETAGEAADATPRNAPTPLNDPGDDDHHAPSPGTAPTPLNDPDDDDHAPSPG